MTDAKAISKFVRVSPKRARMVAEKLRGRSVDEALLEAQFTGSKAARVIYKTLESAIANAEHNFDLDVDRLIVHEATVDKGPVLKRMKPRSRGRADIMRKPTSHITVVVREREDES